MEIVQIGIFLGRNLITNTRQNNGDFQHKIDVMIIILMVTLKPTRIPPNYNNKLFFQRNELKNRKIYE